MTHDSLSKFMLTVAVFVLLLATIAQARAERAGVSNRDDISRGLLMLKSEDGSTSFAPTLDTDVKISVTGLFARVTVRQKFHNPTDKWAEGTYVFPLPETAAVDHMRLEAGGRIIEGQIEEKIKARKKYEKAKKQGKRASLVSQQRTNIFTTKVANIGPDEEVIVQIEYQQMIGIDNGVYSIRFPMVVGPRFIPGRPTKPINLPHTPPGSGWAPDTDEVSDASHITPPVQKPEAKSINPVKIAIDLVPGFETAYISSRYHPVNQATEGKGRYRITLADDVVFADRDFALVWKPKPGAQPVVSVFTEQDGSDFYTLFLISPPSAQALKNRSIAREVIFVIDVSGSMHGASIKQAKAALLLALDRLKPDDTFNVLAFNHLVKPFSPNVKKATRQNINRAKQFVSSLNADGGTMIATSLAMALGNSDKDDIPTSGKIRQVIFLTDGSVGNEDQLFNIIRVRIGATRLFTVGIGSAPNSNFMRNAARYGRGTFTYIGKTSEVKQMMGALFAKLETPAFTDIKIGVDETNVAKIFPSPIPDLYLDRPVVVVMKTKKPIRSASLTGFFGGARWSRKTDFSAKENRPGIKVFWARKKIEKLMDDYRRVRRESEAKTVIRKEIVEVALKGHLVSRFTSLVAVDITPVRPDHEKLKSHAMKTNMPDGWSYKHVFGGAQTATSGPLDLITGILSILTGAAFLYWRRRSATSWVS